MDTAVMSRSLRWRKCEAVVRENEISVTAARLNNDTHPIPQ